MKFVALGLAIVTYLVALFIVYCVYINFFSVNVVFYSSLQSAAIALFLFGFALFLLPVFKIFNIFDKVHLIFTAGLIGYVCAISLPTVIDRSLSFYILEKLQQRDGAIQLSKFEYIFTEEYMREHKLVDIRLTEQSESGTIIIDGQCVRLTSKGHAFADFSRFFRQNFLPKKRLLRGRYTDELIDPFSRSDPVPGYLCN